MGSDHKITRREFLKVIAGGFAAAVFYKLLYPFKRWIPVPHEITGSIVGASHRIGHLLRTPAAYVPTRHISIPVVIVGGGMSGLCAGWKLKKAGHHDFLLFELEPELGGNSRSGNSDASDYPWGAHYVPIPDKEMTEVCEILQDFDVITGFDLKGQPIFDDRFLCFAPQERLFLYGRWQEDLFPAIGASDEDIRQFREFRSKMISLKEHRGRDGKKAFTIPIETSSRDPEILALDSISMEEYLHRQGWNSPRLRWYIEYACRDDFGSLSKNTSAWAGIHYWVSRPTAFTKKDNTVLTWPEGNGWLVKQLKKRIAEHCRTNALVINVEQKENGVLVDFLDVNTKEVTQVTAQKAIFACPQFIVSHILSPWKRDPPAHLKDFTYAPWMVANLRISGIPKNVGSPLAWDNVLYNSDSLGYVVATHQNLLSREPTESVWTYYYPLPQSEPSEERAMMLTRSWEEWRAIILNDLRHAHPDIDEHVRNIDVMLWGHGMIRPTPGFIWGASREKASRTHGNIIFAHSDLSGISIFEEALYWGVRAANRIIENS